MLQTAARQFSNEKPAQSSSSDNNSNKENDPKKNMAVFIFAGFILLFILMNSREKVRSQLRNDEGYLFDELIPKGEVISIQPGIEPSTKVIVTLQTGAVYRGTKVREPEECRQVMDLRSAFSEVERKIHKLEDELGIPVKERIEILKPTRIDTKPWQLRIFDSIIDLAILFMIMKSFGRGASSGGGFGDVFKNKFKFTTSEEIRTSAKAILFKDVAGMHAAKEEVMEFMEYLKNPMKFSNLGAKLPRGALLLGPPGCGKTLLVKALAAEANVPFVTAAGSEFIEVIGGLGARRIRSLFQEARQRSPCIIFIDEIDAIGRSRSSSSQVGNSEQSQTLNQLLVEMDGMDTQRGTIVFAATNRGELLDPALLRPGRFDRHITIELPDKIERQEIFDIYLKKYLVSPSALAMRDRLADLTPGMTGADIANICNEAALNAAKNFRDKVDTIDFDAAIERVIAGAAKKSRVLTEDERRMVAFHEAGHALVGWMLKHSDKLLKVTIVPRTNAALGFAQVSPKERYFVSQEELFDKMAVLLGGRIAEAIVFNRVSSGAMDDLRKVTDLAYDQVRKYGFSPVVGHLSYNLSKEDLTYGNKPYSEWMTNVIDEEANQLVAKAYKYAEKTLSGNKDKLIKIGEALLQKETLNYDDMVDIIGPPVYEKT